MEQLLTIFLQAQTQTEDGEPYLHLSQQGQFWIDTRRFGFGQMGSIYLLNLNCNKKWQGRKDVEVMDIED